MEQYRAMIAQEKESQKTDQTQAETQTKTVEEPKQTTEVASTPTVVDEIDIEGVGKVKIDELKNGYLRQSDYTKKTQQLSAEKKEAEDALILFDYLKKNPELASELAKKAPQLKPVNAESSKVSELEDRLANMQMQLELRDLLAVHPGIDSVKLINTAKEKNISLDDAYKIIAPVEKAKEVNVDDLEKQIREKIMKELQDTNNTRTIITSNGNATNVSGAVPQISPAEHKVAMNMKMSDDEYIKWRDAGLKKK